MDGFEWTVLPEKIYLKPPPSTWGSKIPHCPGRDANAKEGRERLTPLHGGRSENRTRLSTSGVERYTRELCRKSRPIAHHRPSSTIHTFRRKGEGEVGVQFVPFFPKREA